MTALMTADLESDNENENENENDNLQENEEKSISAPSHRQITLSARPFTFPALLSHSLRTSSAPSLSLSQLATQTGWSTKRISSRIRHLEQTGMVSSQLRNYGRQFISEYALTERLSEQGAEKSACIDYKETIPQPNELMEVEVSEQPVNSSQQAVNTMELEHEMTALEKTDMLVLPSEMNMNMDIQKPIKQTGTRRISDMTQQRRQIVIDMVCSS